MSDNSVLATPNTATLSVTRTFMSVPSRDLIISRAPSTLSMVPRMRTGGGCCAHATDASTDNVSAVATAFNEEIPGMVSPFLGFCWQFGKHFNAEAIPPVSPALHRRCQPVAADTDAVGLERAIR